MSAGELEHEWAGTPGRLIRERYRQAGAVYCGVGFWMGPQRVGSRGHWMQGGPGPRQAHPRAVQVGKLGDGGCRVDLDPGRLIRSNTGKQGPQHGDRSTRASACVYTWGLEY